MMLEFRKLILKTAGTCTQNNERYLQLQSTKKILVRFRTEGRSHF